MLFGVGKADGAFWRLVLVLFCFTQRLGWDPRQMEIMGSFCCLVQSYTTSTFCFASFLQFHIIHKDIYTTAPSDGIPQSAIDRMWCVSGTQSPAAAMHERLPGWCPLVAPTHGSAYYDWSLKIWRQAIGKVRSAKRGVRFYLCST
jgi:hypothetical protein